MTKLSRPTQFRRKGRALPGQTSDEDLGLNVTLRLTESPQATVINKELVQVGRVSTGDYVEMSEDGVKLFANTTLHIDLQSDGDIFVGKDTTTPADTYMSVFVNPQTYNSEVMGAGDMLLGDNSAGQPNLFWDRSVPSLAIREGTTPQLTLGSSIMIVGDTANEHIEVTATAVNINDGATTHAQLSGGTLTLGETTAEHINITGSVLQLKDGAQVWTAIGGGSMTIGDAANEHILINPTALNFRDGNDIYLALGSTAIVVGKSTDPNIAINANAIFLRDGSTVKGEWQTDGDLFIGTDISTAAGTKFAIFAGAQTYNSESMGAGDVLIGDNSAGKHNILFDISEGEIQVRSGTTPKFEVDDDDIYIGETATEHIHISNTTIQFNDGGTTYTSLAAGELIIGNTSNDNIRITSSVLQIRDASTVLAKLQDGVLYLGDPNSEHIVINEDAITMKDGATTLSNYSASQVTIGNASDEHFRATATAIQFRDGATVYGELSAGNLVLGRTGNEHINITSSAVEFKNSSTVRASLTGNTWTLGRASTQHIEITTSAVNINNGGTTLASLDGSTLTLGNTGDDHIVITNSSLSLTGGGGDVTIDGSGIQLAAGTGNTNKLRALDGSDTIMELHADVDTGVAGIASLRGRGKDSGTHEGFLELIAITDDGSAHAGAASVVIELDTDADRINLNAGDVRTTGSFRLANMSTSTRNSLSALNGMVIYNTTDHKFQGYENGSWTNLS